MIRSTTNRSISTVLLEMCQSVHFENISIQTAFNICKCMHNFSRLNMTFNMIFAFIFIWIKYLPNWWLISFTFYDFAPNTKLAKHEPYWYFENRKIPIEMSLRIQNCRTWRVLCSVGDVKQTKKAKVKQPSKILNPETSILYAQTQRTLTHTQLAPNAPGTSLYT